MGRQEPMSDMDFKVMIALFKLVDFFSSYVGRRAQRFGIKEGMTVVDYGCGPGRYAVHFARLVGEKGRVIAVDIKDLALEETKRRLNMHKLSNVSFNLAKGYDSGVEEGVADMVFAIDMFFKIRDPTPFLKELGRIGKDDSVLIIDDEHQLRSSARKKIQDSGVWRIVEETGDHLKCRKAPGGATAVPTKP